MKKFKFSLESLRRYRGTLFDREKAKLEALLLERHNLEKRIEQLQAELEQARQRIRLLALIPVEELAAFQSFSRHVDLQCQRLAEERKAVEERIAAQKEAMLEARRKVESLDRLKEKRYESWQKEADREFENTVNELVIARFRRPSET